MPEDELAVLVDQNDIQVGYRSKRECHEGPGKMHRGIVGALFNDDGKIVLQRRGANVPRWPLYWDTSFAGHVHAGESYEDAFSRKAKHELNVHAQGVKVFSFVYSARLGSVYEKEYCVLMIGTMTGDVAPNREVVDKLRWQTLERIVGELEIQSSDYTPWGAISLCGLLLCARPTRGISMRSLYLNPTYASIFGGCTGDRTIFGQIENRFANLDLHTILEADRHARP